MLWVREEHAGALAVVLTWLSALLPWNVTYSPTIPGTGGAGALFVRFPFFQVASVWNVTVADPVRFSVPVPGWLLPAGVPSSASALVFQSGQGILVGYQVWAVAAAVLLLAVAFSVVYYRREERVEALAVDPVGLLGGLLGLSGLLFGLATYLVATRGFPGVPLPIGTVLLLVFAALLLSVDRA